MVLCAHIVYIQRHKRILANIFAKAIAKDFSMKIARINSSQVTMTKEEEGLTIHHNGNVMIAWIILQFVSVVREKDQYCYSQKKVNPRQLAFQTSNSLFKILVKMMKFRMKIF